MWPSQYAVAVQQFVYEVGKFLSERAARGGKGLVLVHCTHGFNRTGAMLVHFAQRTAAWPKLNENLKAFAAARPPGIYKPEYVKELFDEYLERRFSTTLDPPVPEWKRGVVKHPDAPPLDEAEVPPGDLFSVKSNPEYAATLAESLAEARVGRNGRAREQSQQDHRGRQPRRHPDAPRRRAGNGGVRGPGA